MPMNFCREVLGWLRAAFREPLGVFIVFSVVLYLYFVAQRPQAENVIFVSEDRLQEYYQYKRQSFGLPAVANQFQTMPPEQRDALVEDFITEEILVREARQMGLDGGDFVIRQRLVQKLEFLADTQSGMEQKAQNRAPDWYETHKESYRLPSEISFTHVFFASSGSEAAPAPSVLMGRAEDARKKLNGDPALEPSAFGNRFAYHKSYQRRSLPDIESHFGRPFAEAVFALPAREDWQGPVRSRHGLHLVRVFEKTQARLPALPEIREKVVFDLKTHLSRQARKAYADRLRKKYRIVNQ